MDQTLEKLKLKENFNFKISNISKQEFVSRFRKEVTESDLGLFENLFEVFQGGKNDYKGKVSFDGFTIKRRRKFFDRNKFMVKVEGTYLQKENDLFINTEINAYNPFILFFFCVVIFIYIIFILAIFLSSNSEESLFFSPFLLIHAALMIGIPYIMLRKSVKNMKRDLERDFIYIARKDII